ncbi:SlyX family protein [Silvimonas amylolytica]|uniref:Protein SlyX n=1 Tax=Silvimonas amylolytica TaxID=449663 RepID=A0ABQ2PIS7_9NEIS|nr:SlyX family protein [Silvimonas amylolytica]GGP25490.1 protein SlyX [Silvimonas amylolytica]
MESRITELEIKVALQDDLLDTLNRVVAEQSQQISRLQQELMVLAGNVRVLEADSGRTTSLRDDIPPHY